MKNLLYFSFFFIFLIVAGCSNTEEYIAKKNEIVFRESSSPYQITRDIVIDSTMRMIVLPGAHLVFHDTAKIKIYGSIHIWGTSDNPAILKPFKEDSLWGGIKLFQPDDSCIFENVIVKNGLLWGEDADVIFKNYRFYNTYNLSKFDAIARFFRGSTQIRDSYFESNQTGEGLLVHSPNKKLTIVENCEFHGITDAIEYMKSNKNGFIKGNKIYNIQQIRGDAIDLNGCTGVRIENNYIENVIDFGLELGNDNFGPCKDIIVSQNIFVKCASGVTVKGGSNAIIINNTFYKNTYGVSCIINKFISNLDPNRLVVINSIFSESIKNDFSNNENSTIIFENCLSDSQLLNGQKNLFSNPLFIAANKSDFRLSNNSPCIGYASISRHKEYNIKCEDIGAICSDGK
jgi:hypothetical protein